MVRAWARIKSRFDGFLTPDGVIGIPAVRTLSDEYRDVPEPVDSDREPAPEPPGRLKRAMARVRDRVKRGS
jgi:hypothetical protein